MVWGRLRRGRAVAPGTPTVLDASDPRHEAVGGAVSELGPRLRKTQQRVAVSYFSISLCISPGAL